MLDSLYLQPSNNSVEQLVVTAAAAATVALAVARVATRFIAVVAISPVSASPPARCQWFQDDHGMSNKIGSSQIGFDILVYSIPTAL